MFGFGKEETVGSKAEKTAQATQEALQALVEKYDLPMPESAVFFIKEYAKSVGRMINKDPQKMLDEASRDMKGRGSEEFKSLMRKPL